MCNTYLVFRGKSFVITLISANQQKCTGVMVHDDVNFTNPFPHIAFHVYGIELDRGW